MAKLLKLQLSGIRNFDPFETQQLKFPSPLTLILGQNGCGKTTIIEAIKYACTGDLPEGTSNGQGFINDPMISGRNSTKGQIKLKIVDPRGNEVTVFRVMEVSKKATSLKFNSKLAEIRIVGPDGTDRSINGRCVDITTECCQIMNVPPSVINNVIFCHQENSSWPLAEGKKLKEKFDEIFDADKYNKCTEAYRKKLKLKQNDIGKLQLEVKFTKDKKEQLDKEKKNLENKEEKLQTFEDDIRTKNETLEPIKKRFEEILELEHNLNKLDRELTKQKERKNGIVEEQNTIKESLKFEFEGSDGELQDNIKSFEADTRKDQNWIAELEKKKNDIEEKNKQIDEAIRESQTSLGQLNQEKSQYERKNVNRRKLIEEAGNSMNLNELKDFDDNDGAKFALNKLKNTLESNRDCLAALIEEHERELNSLQSTIDRTRENLARTKQNKLSKEKEVPQCEQKIVTIENELTVLSTNDDLLKTYSQQIETIDTTLFKWKATFQETEECQKIDTYKNDIQTVEHQLDNLDTDYKTLLRNEVTEGKIESEKQKMMEKLKEINKIKSKHFDSLKQLFKGTVPETNLKESVLAMQKEADLIVKDLNEAITKKQKEVTTLEVQRHNLLEKISACEKELKSNQEKITRVCTGNSFNETLNSSFQKKERLQIDKGQYSSVKIIYGQFIKKFQEESPCCPVCETNFTQKSTVVQKIISSLKNKLEKVPQELTRVESELETEEKFYSKLQQLKFVNEETEILEKEKLPQLKHQLSEIDSALKKHLNVLNALENKQKEPQAIVEISKNIISDVSTLDQNQCDVEKSKRTVEGLEQVLTRIASEKSKHEVEAEIDQLKSEITELRGKIDSQTKKINSHRERIQNALQEKNNLITKQMKITEALQGKPTLEAQKNELSEKIKTLTEEIAKLEEDKCILEDELKGLTENKESVTNRNKLLVQEKRNAINTHSTIVHNIETLQKEIDDYLNSDIENRLKSTEEKLTELKSKDSKLKETKSTIIKAISEKKEKLDKQELYYVTLQQNVRLREKQAQEKTVEMEIENLKKQIGGSKYSTIHEEKRELESQREALETEINKLAGERDGLIQTIAELRQNLDEPENKKAYANYIKKLCELKIAEKVVDDLKIFVAALEKAILEFHRSKMVQINKHIRELWRDIYRGNDIDFIEIKTEYASSNSMRRSYNYKVVQVKKGNELDMRGRCSAGQKVLACLIIRIALAETLSFSCGILALDEPTTNLDRENIHSLCDTLSRIVNSRQQEKNFQLIIITHDEEFVNILTRIEGVSYYHKVTRNNNGFSVIKREDAL